MSNVQQPSKDRRIIAVLYGVVLAALLTLLFDRFVLRSGSGIESVPTSTPVAGAPAEDGGPVLVGRGSTAEALPTAPYRVRLSVYERAGVAKQALKGARVFALERTPDGSSRALWTGDTDASGKAEFELAAAPVTIIVRHAGLLGTSGLIAAPPDGDEPARLELTLHALAILRVFVTDREHRPIAAARATLIYPGGLGASAALFEAADRPTSQMATNRTGPDGRLIFSGVVPQVPARIEVSHPDFGSYSAALSALGWGEDRDVPVLLDRGGSVTWSCVAPDGESISSGVAAVMPIEAEVMRPAAERDLLLDANPQSLSGLGEGRWRLIVTARLEPSGGAAFYSRAFSISTPDAEVNLGELHPEGQAVEFLVEASGVDTSGRRVRISLHSLEHAAKDRLRVRSVNEIYVPAAQQRVVMHGLGAALWRVSSYLTKPWATTPDMSLDSVQFEFTTPSQRTSYPLAFQREYQPAGSILVRVTDVPETVKGSERAVGAACVVHPEDGAIAVLPGFSVEVGAVFPLTGLDDGQYTVLAWGGGGSSASTVDVVQEKRAVVEVDLTRTESARITSKLMAPDGQPDAWFPLAGEWYILGSRPPTGRSPMPVGTFRLGAQDRLDLEVPPRQRIEILVRGRSGRMARVSLDPMRPGRDQSADLVLEAL